MWAKYINRQFTMEEITNGQYIHMILPLPISLKKTQINIIKIYDFSPIRFAKYEKIDTAVDINSIKVNSVGPVKNGKCAYSDLAI